ncbi:AzlC family ABC transporter permease [Aliiroseovarius sp. YM-037]|uniref:AzlC family ABC transporter permease n=1 Tax=Aliiroseovarius sp. YM-037 TaxID=3341728 RepID=UPI003A8041BC
MASSTSKSAYLQGIRDGAPFVIVIVPFAMLFGVVATEAGLNIVETMGFTILVIAGAAQFAAIQLMVEDAPTIIILATALAVNLRMAMYSASMAPHIGEAPFWKRAFIAYFLVDQSYAVSINEYEKHPDRSIAEKLSYFFGVVTPICPLWYAFTLIGALAGAQIPPEFALDFAVPITFIALVAPAIRTMAHMAAVIVSVTLALLLAFLPYNLGLLIAAFGAMAVGARVELMMEAQK